MSNLIYACWRTPTDDLGHSIFQWIADRITLVNPQAHSHQVAHSLMEGLCLTGPVGAAEIRGKSVRVGVFAGPSSGWDMPGSTVPDGTFAMVRSDDSVVELCSDFSGTRTLWYVLTEHYFFASTSQRALICLLRDFKVNKSAVSWFLSSGSLGPLDAWDKRLKRLPANARLFLDRSNWRLDLRATPIEFRPRPWAAGECRKEFARILREAILSFEFPPDRWILPLSGGLDSRCILLMMHKSGLTPRTVTWGLASSISQPGNDAYVARQLSRHFGLVHEYLVVDHLEQNPIEVIDRFLSASGGTTDQLSGYLDGLGIWSSLAAQNMDGIIRGDAGFNGGPVYSKQQARTSSSMVLLSDFLDEHTTEQISDGEQSLPDDFQPTPGESHACYRDRIYHSFRIPIGLAALSDVKTPFVEIASPLLSRRVIEFIREMPDSLRANRDLYVRLVKDLSPSIPFSFMHADDNSEDFLWSIPYVQWLEDELESDMAMRLFPLQFRQALMADIRQGPFPGRPSRSFRAVVKRFIPSQVIQTIRARKGHLAEVPGLRQVALRAALICRMIRIYEDDALLLNSGEKEASA